MLLIFQEQLATMQYQVSEKEENNIESWYDVIVVGGGTAGLAAAYLAAKKNYRVILLEKGAQVGPLPRGESMAYFPLEDEILGEGFVDSITTNGPAFRRYHSPNDEKNVLVDVHTPYRFFPWRKLIDRLESRALDAGVLIQKNSSVLHPLLNSSGVCIGVQYQDSNEDVKNIYGLVTLGADGHDSIIGQAYGIDYSTINCPIVKFLGKNAHIDISQTPNPQFFLLSPGQLEIAPNFPPAAAYYFPIGGQKIEAGLMLRMGQVPKLKNIHTPDHPEIMRVWSHLKEHYPGFSEVFKGIEVEEEFLTQMPNARMVENFICGKGGAILIGDSAGFVDANGSSGLYYGMKMASEWMSILMPVLEKLKSLHQDFSDLVANIWTSQQTALFNSQFLHTPVYKHIKKSYKLIGLSETIIFRWFKTWKSFNRFWWLFAFMIKSAS